MKILRELGMILGVCLLGEWVASILPFAFPGSVAALLLMVLLLVSKVIKERQIQDTSDFMLRNMSIVFLPASIGIMEVLGKLKGQMFGLLCVVLLSLILTFLGSYLAVRVVQKLIR